MECNSGSLLGFQALPVEIKLRIFSYFTPQFLTTTVSRVCTAWWKLSMDPWLWTELLITCKENKSFLTRCAMLRKLTIQKTKRDNTTALKMIGEAFSSPTLKTLRIECAILCEDLLKNLVQRFPCLDTLEFDQCEANLVEYEFVREVCKFSKLKKFKVGFELKPLSDEYGIIYDHFLNSITENFSSLETLHLDCSPSLSNDCIQNLARLRQETLKDVSLIGCQLSDEGVSCFSVCSRLSDLVLSCTADITDVSFDALLELNLKTLEFYCILDQNRKVSSQALCRFFRSSCRVNLKRVTLYDFRNVKDGLVEIVRQTCVNLTFSRFE